MQTEFCQMACFSSSGDEGGGAVWILILSPHAAIILFYVIIDNQDRPYLFYRLMPFNQPI